MRLIFLLFLSISPVIQPSESSEIPRKCEPLAPNQNVEVTCFTKTKVGGSFQTSNCSLEHEVGATATYKCRPYYIPFDSAKQPKLECNVLGHWQGLKKFNRYRCKEDCGVPVGNAEPLHNVDIFRFQHPWHAMLFVENNSSDWIYLCGASIIRNRILLTAAHCIVTNSESLRVVLGGVSTIFFKNTVATGSQIRSVQRIYISEHYDPAHAYQADIAILWLSDTIEYNEYISPVCLPYDYVADVGVMKSRSKGKIASFGVTPNNSVSDSMRVIQLEVKSNTECFNNLHRVLSDSQYCAGSEQGNPQESVICNGDSGNGMTFASNVHEKFYLHGLVSSSDADTAKGACQSLVVFTRIYPFVFWIRDVLEGIISDGETTLNQNIPYPYSAKGLEVNFEIYQGLPTEWENRITSLKLRYAYTTLRDVLTSLENAQTLNSIQFNHVILQMDDQNIRPLVTPLLTNFYMDLLRPDFELDSNRTFPESITEKLIKSYLFFTKDYGQSDTSLSEFIQMKVDIDLIVHIFKLIHVNVKRGEIFLNQVPAIPFFGDSIIRWDRLDFTLKNLALHRTSFDLSSVSSSWRTLTSLILSRVELIRNPWFSSYQNLKYLLLDPVITQSADVLILRRADHTPTLRIGLNELPASLEWFSASTTVHLTEYSENQLLDFRKRHRIARSPLEILPNLKTFCCDYCRMDQNVRKNFSAFYSNVSNIFLWTNERVALDSLLRIPTLKSVFLESGVHNMSNFIGLQKFVTLSNGATSVRFRRSKNTWKVTRQGESFSERFNCHAGRYFWTSELNFKKGLRLKSFELSAMQSRNFVFNGTTYSKSLGHRIEFDGIRQEIQSDLMSITFIDVEVTPRTLYKSIENCANLKSVTLLNTHVQGNGQRYTFITGNLTLILESVRVGPLNLEYVYEMVDGKLIAGVIPFQHVGKFSNTTAVNPLVILLKNVSSVRLEETVATLFSIDSTVEEIGSSTKHIRQLMSRLPVNHPLKPRLKHLEDMESTFDKRIVPRTLKIPGLNVVNQNNIKAFFSDPLVKFMGRLGLIRYFIKRHSNYLNLISPVNQTTSVFPPVQAISLSILRGHYLKTGIASL